MSILASVLIAQLEQAIKEVGDRPVVAFEVHKGIPSSTDITGACRQPDYDGGDIAIWLADTRDPPEWLGAAHAAIGCEPR